MSQAKFPFGKDFQIKILSFMFHDFDFLIFAQELANPNFFSDKVLAWFFTTMRDYFIDFQMRLDDSILRNEMKKAAAAKRIKAQEVQAYFQTYKQVIQKTDGKDYVTKELISFCQHQAIKAAALEVPDLLAKNDFDAVKALWSEAFNVGASAADIGMQFFVAWPERLGTRAVKLDEMIFPTGITALDVILGGGIRVKQLGLWMAPTNRGKSVALVHCGKRAVIMRKKVIHYTAELSADDVAERYDASFAKIPVRDLLNREADLARTMEKLGQRMGNSLIIKEYPTKSASVNTIRSHLQQCMAVGFVPDMIIVDYLDLLKSDFRRKEKREELSDIAEALRGLAGEMNIPCWSATQARRSAISKEVHDEEDVSEDIGKMNISDLVITINQTKEQYGNGIMKLLVAKNRNGPRWESVEIVTSLARMCFFNPPKGDEKATGNAGQNTAKATGAKAPPPGKPKAPPAKKKTPPLRRPSVM